MKLESLKNGKFEILTKGSMDIIKGGENTRSGREYVKSETVYVDNEARTRHQYRVWSSDERDGDTICYNDEVFAWYDHK